MSHALRSNCLRFGAKGNSPTALSPALQVWSSRGRSGFSRVRLGQPAPSFTHPILIVTTRASHCRAAWGIPEAQYVLGMAKSRKGDAPGQGKPRGAESLHRSLCHGCSMHGSHSFARNSGKGSGHIGSRVLRVSFQGVC